MIKVLEKSLETESWIEEEKTQMNVLSSGEALVEPSCLCDFSSRPARSIPVVELKHKLILARGGKDRVCTGSWGKKDYLKGYSRCQCVNNCRECERVMARLEYGT